MLLAFLFSERRAIEPLLPLRLFRDPIIAVSSISVFMLGVGMFGVILYVPLFMQGVLGVSATRSGNLLTPLLMGAVVGSAGAGQLIARTGRYKLLAITGSVLSTFGMFLLSRMDKDTANGEVLRNMIVAGLGMGLLMPIYTLVVQNVAPVAQMGAATASTQFFRSIGSTVGVAIFGSVLLTIYHDDFQRGIPPKTPALLLSQFQEPLRLVQIRPRLEAAVAKYPGGPELLHRLFENVRDALVHGLHAIFTIGTILMVIGIVVNLFLREIPLRKRAAPPPVD
jgi:MFS family permease